MKCRQCRQQLLNSERPQFPAVEVQAHLAGCMACRTFQRQLLVIEANVPRVPVPPSTAKAKLLQQILHAPDAAPAPPPRILPMPRRLPAQATPRWVPIARWTAGVAAAVILIAVGTWLGSRLVSIGDGDHQVVEDVKKTPEQPVTKRPNPFAKNGDKKTTIVAKKDEKVEPPVVVAKGKTLVGKLMDCDLKLAEAETPRQRVEALAELADVLQLETQQLSKSARPTDLNKLAAMYKQVIDDGVVPRAKDLPMAERGDVLKGVTAQLAQTGRDAEKLAKTIPQSAEALRVIASAARAGDVQLRQLMVEGAE